MKLTGFDGAVAVVSGAARGIGFAVAEALARSNVRLALVDRDAAGLEDAATRLGGETFSRALDVTSAMEVKRFVGDAHARFGRIDFLVNVAGIQRLGLLAEMSVEDFDATFDVNVKGTFLMTQAVAQTMLSVRKGAIVTISSNAALVPRVKQGAYCASKAGTSHLMRVFALELGPLGIRCNSVDPGATETEMIRQMVSTMNMGELLIKGSLEGFRVGTPLQKNAQVDDVANAVLFLLSDQAGHITMHDLVVDGGATLGA
jgi:2,3-dihydro-2,3-dihydroxybenzoate dehydrogenase